MFRWLLVHLFFIQILSSERPNILFIAVDDLRPSLGCFGDQQAITPNIDKLAEESITFPNAFCMIAVCGASRANLMTGIHPTAKRFITYTSTVDNEAPGATTLPQVFKDHGYITISNGKIFHNPKDSAERSWSETPWQPKISGLASYDPQTTKFLSKKKNRGRIYENPDVSDHKYQDGLIAQKTIKDLKRLSKTSKPFFLACGFKKPHMPFYAPKKYWNYYNREQLELADNQYRPHNSPKDLKGSGEYSSYHLADYKVNSPEWHKMMVHGYYACVSYVDQQIGHILNEIKALNLDQNTIVVLWGDHGFHLGEHNFWGKNNTLLPSVKIPLIIKVPNQPSSVFNDFVETADIFPTLCQLSDIPTPKTVQGRSFVEHLSNRNSIFRDHAYSRFTVGDVIITKDFSYTKYRSGSEMLYHLKKDLDENTNLSHDSEYGNALNKMRKILNLRLKQAAELTSFK